MDRPTPIAASTIRDALRLDRNSPLPLHAQAEQLLRDLIEAPEYRDGGCLPSEVMLASQLGVSRNTLRMAFDRLVQDGRLERKAGVGTRVVQHVVNSGVGAWRSFTREMQAKQITVETYAITPRFLKGPRAAVRALRVDQETKLLRLDRVRGWDGEPEVHFRSWLHPRLGLTTKDDFSRPLYEMIHERCGIVSDESVEEMDAVAANRYLAEWLEVEVGMPLLRRVRTVIDTGGRTIEYAVVHYRCNRFRLSLSLRHE